VQILNQPLEKCSRYLRMLPFLRVTCCLDNLIRMPENECVYPSSIIFDLELRRTIIHDFFSRDWCVFFCVLLNLVEHLLRDMLSSLPRFVQPMHQGQLDRGSWTVKCSRQCIDGDWDMVARFCNILHEFNLVVSKLKSSKIRVPL
jgi:hypothetical protein